LREESPQYQIGWHCQGGWVEYYGWEFSLRGKTKRQGLRNPRRLVSIKAARLLEDGFADYVAATVPQLEGRIVLSSIVFNGSRKLAKDSGNLALRAVLEGAVSGLNCQLEVGVEHGGAPFGFPLP
jgi:hypothetical protein